MYSPERATASTTTFTAALGERKGKRKRKR
jgi:hypothetical protein